MPDATPSYRVVTCPTCGESSRFDASNPYRPFCCERCKHIDFGAWASENFRMPTEVPPDDQTFGDPKLD